MSGDVQPRKRKDKKKKKDETTEQIPTQPQIPVTASQSEDVNIHVHKEDGTGGGICAKIIFFLLFSALAVVIGLIITEHRGLTDLDTAEQESRFSQLFEGWIDSNQNHEDEGDHIVSSLDDEDHEEHEEEVENISPEEEHDEEDGHEEEEEEEQQLSEEVSQADDEEDEEEEEEGDDDEQVLESEEQEADNDDESELKEVSEENEEEEDEEQDASKDVDEEEDEEDASDNEDDIGEDEEEDEVKEASEEENVSPEKENESEEAKDGEKQEANEEDEEVEDNEDNKDDAEKQEIEEENEDQSNSKMVIKIGVGVALLVVAHVVLVRKWKSASVPTDTPQKEATPDLSRRNTIVVPPDFQEIEQDIEDNCEEEYSDEDGEVDSEDERTESKSAKLKYQELKTTYTRSLTPESETEFQSKAVGGDEEEYEEDDEDEDEEEEEEEESEGEGEYEKEDDDEELLKRLEAKYGKLQGGSQAGKKQDDFDDQFSSWKRVNVRHDNEPEESDSDKQSDVDTYEYENITNKDDYQIKNKIDEAQKNINNNAAYAIKLFDDLLQNYSSSPRSLYGKAQALDQLADQKRSNELLQKAIVNYLQILDLKNVPDALFIAAADRCINRLRFIGSYSRAIDIHYKLIARFPQDPRYSNQLVVTYLTINRVNKARMILKEILSKYPNDGFALVHYGFILKTTDNNLNESVKYLKKGISTKQQGVIDGRFYFHLGDALARLGKTEEAMKVYEEGVKHKLFLSKYQRSLYNVKRLEGKPWWRKEETPYINLYKSLESNWERIRDEGLSVLKKNGLFQNESENLKNTGDWKQFELFARGQKNVENCKKCPFTCKIIESIPDAKDCKRGQTKFSVMHPGTHVWPHCGPTNCRLRVHLGLQVPAHTYIRVADDTRSWENGKVFIFDDSFEHEVWHNGTTVRLVLITDVWHPQLTSAEKRSLSTI